MEDDYIYFFGYGANRDLTRIAKILGKVPETYLGAIIENYHLYYQDIHQIPNPPQNILLDVWGKKFKAYTIHPGQGIVAGIAWKITKQELEIIKEWEFIGIWREIVSVKIRTFDGKEIEGFTDKAVNSERNIGYYDGINYPSDLNTDKNIVTDMEKSVENSGQTKQLENLRVALKSMKI